MSIIITNLYTEGQYMVKAKNMNAYNHRIQTLLWGCFLAALLSSCHAGGSKKNRELPDSTVRKVVLLSPPVFSVLKLFDNDRIEVVGANPRTFETVHAGLLGIIAKEYRDIRTDFADRDFNVNKETLLSLHPDMVFYYGGFQKAAMGKLPVRTIDMDMRKGDPEAITVEWEQLLAKALELPYAGIMEKEWKHTRRRCTELCEKTASSPKRGLFIFSYLNGRMTVSGRSTYGSAFLHKAGIINVAEELSNQKEVGIEQLYAWHPDVIFLFLGSKDAFIKSKKRRESFPVHSVPQGIFSWGSPCAESPLMPLWMFARTYPGIYPMEEFKAEARRFYAEVFQKEIPDRLLNEMFGEQ